jgi:hypothetical protein
MTPLRKLYKLTVPQHMGGYNVTLPWASCGNEWNNNLTCVDVDRTKGGLAV